MSLSVGDEEAIVHANRRRFYDVLDIDPGCIAIPRQVHGDVVLQISDPGLYESCDALVTDRAGVYLTVSVADCLPIFLFDPVRLVVAAVHSGWKGSVRRILSKTLSLLQDRCGSQTGDVLAFIGPGSGSCCYEVGDDVASQFDPGYSTRDPDRKARLDLKAFNRDLLIHAGVPPGQVEISDRCTICLPELFHSYRRDGQRSGRMMGVIGMRR